MTFLGIDVGTSAVKAVLVDGDQKLLAEAEAPLAISRPHPLWSEQDPDAWWTATREVLAALRAAEPVAWAAVRGIGLSGQMHGAVVLDAADRPLRPAILWNDGRAQAECVGAGGAGPGPRDLAGVPPMPGFTAPKLLWLAAHEPELFARIAKVLLPKDYVRLQLSGEHVTDPCDAAGTLWLDEARRAWSPAILAATGLTVTQMPRIVEGSVAAGGLLPGVAATLGLPPGIADRGWGRRRRRGCDRHRRHRRRRRLRLARHLGQYFVTTADLPPLPRAADPCLLPRAARSAGSSARHCSTAPAAWAGPRACWASPTFPPWSRRVEAGWRGPSRVLFLPYLAGERTPHDDPHARGVLFGLDADTGAIDVAQAVLEGVAFSLAEAQDCLSAAGTELDAIAAIGGGARSPFWMRLLATVLDRPVTVYAGAARGPAFGAARLARMAVTGEAAAAVCGKPEVAAVLEPELPLVDAYRERSRRFRALYRALRPEFAAGIP